MIKLMIVDDEPIAIRSIQSIIRKHMTNITAVETASNGLEAIERANVFYPDLVLMDINMPEMNGIETIRKMKENHPQTFFIIISAFDSFDYAASATNEEQVLGYLLKPVLKEKLLEAINKAIAYVEEIRQRKQKELEYEKQLRKVRPILEGGFISSICSPENNTQEIKEYSKLFEFKNRFGYVLVTEFGEKTDGVISNKIGAGVLGERYYWEIVNIFKTSCDCIVGKIMLNRIIIFVLCDNQQDVQYQRSSRLAEKFLSKADYLNMDIMVGIGRCLEITEAKKSYWQALQALNEAAGNDGNYPVLHYDDIAQDRELSFYQEYQLLLNQTLNANCANRSFEKANAILKDIYTMLQQQNQTNFAALKNQYIILVVQVLNWKSEIDQQDVSILNKILLEDSPSVLIMECQKYMDTLIKQIFTDKEKKEHSIIQRANTYMEKHFSEEITLEILAKEVNLSPYYLSRFYKEHTGKNYIDFLIGTRLEQAKHMLAETEYGIGEIAGKVGYTDANYFSRLFKKEIGVTASEYKRKYSQLL